MLPKSYPVASPLSTFERIPSTTPGAEPPRDARDSGSARSHSTHLETSSSDRPKMVTYMEPQTAPSYMSVKCARQMLREPNFTRATLVHPSLSNIPKWDLNIGELARSRGTTRLGRNFPASPPKSKYQTYTLFDIRVNSNNIFLTDKMNIVLTPTKEPTVSCWRYTPTPKQDRFQDLLEAICPEFLHTNLTK